MNPILLMTADPELARVLKLALRETTAKVAAELTNPKAAAEALAHNPGMLVVIDLFLPDSSGLEALTLLKRVSENGQFLLLTRIRTRHLIERAFRMGAQDVLQWPLSTDVLRDTILHRLDEQPLAEAEEPAEQAPGKPARKR